MELDLLIQLFEMGKGVMMARVRGMGFGNWMGVRKWMEMGRGKMEETGMGREIGIQTAIERRMETETWRQRQTAVVTEMRRGTGMDLVSLMTMGFLLVRWMGTQM